MADPHDDRHRAIAQIDGNIMAWAAQRDYYEALAIEETENEQDEDWGDKPCL